MILFLDYDGVLHPDHVYLVSGRPVPRADGELLMWAPILVRDSIDADRTLYVATGFSGRCLTYALWRAMPRRSTCAASARARRSVGVSAAGWALPDR